VSTPEIELTTTFVLDEHRRIVSTREPGATHGPLFTLIRSASECAWAVRDDLPGEIAGAISTLARQEPPVRELQTAPVHADQYLALSGGKLGFCGPAFTFPPVLPATPGVVQVDAEGDLQRNFSDWNLGEIAAGRGPVLAVLEAGFPVSVCFCARRSEQAAAAGLETAPAFRGRGFGARVTAAWAKAIRASALVPLYSATWTNAASLAVARKLGLTAYATFWSISDGSSDDSVGAAQARRERRDDQH
jgi:hypothetical protein